MKKAILLLVATTITLTSEVYAQRLVLSAGAELSGLNYGYTFKQQGEILKRGWLNQNGHAQNGRKYAMLLSLQYRVGKHFAFETGLRFSEMGLSVYDARFLNNHGIKGGQPKDNFNGTYSDNGDFNIAEWYLSNYVSGYFFVANRSRFEPYVSAGFAYSYFVSMHSDISNTFFYAPSGENLTLAAHYSPNYLGAFLETGAMIHVRKDRAQGPILFVGIKYSLAGTAVSADYQNVQNGNVSYRDHVTATGSCLSLSFRVGGLLMKR
jgi:hypothetical protein